MLRDRAVTGNIFDFKTWSPRVGRDLCADGRRQDRGARRVRPLLHCRSASSILRRFGPDVPELTRVFQMFEVGPWSDGRHQRRWGDRYARDAERRAPGERTRRRSARKSRTIDQSWTLNVADGVKDQHTDEITFNVEREVARNLSVGAAYIYKHTADLFANIPINRETGQEWEYERIPFQTSAGQQVSLYSVVQKDYNGDGVIDGDDIAWIGDNNTSRRPEHAGLSTASSRSRDYHGLQFVLSKRYSDRWQALASFLYSSSSGFGRRSLRQDINVEGPMFWDDNWMSTLNQTINNLDGPLPFTPKYEFKLSGSYTIPKIEFDIGGSACG